MLENQEKYWLIGIGVGLVALHLNLSQHIERTRFFSYVFLFWTVVIFLLWEKRSKLSIQSSTGLSSFLGISLISLTLYKSLHLFPEDYFLRIAPLMSLFGWGLLASGIRGLKQYRQELFLLLFLAIPWEFIYIFDVSQLTARFSTFILWLLGFEATRQGVWIILPTGSVEVYNGCSGVLSILQLLGLSWIVLILIPTTWKAKIYLPIASILLGFTINALRIALMAILVAMSDIDGFHYWHTGTGSFIFSAVSVSILAIICLILLRRQNIQLEAN
ncbi:MAG: cyanoexosortase A [Cyanobacteria bacterium J06600_6]